MNDDDLELTESAPGTHEGHKCNVDGCEGILEFPPVENCSCHISPPCGACTDNLLTCNICGREIT